MRTPSRQKSHRVVGLQAFLVVWALLVLVRLYWLQVHDHRWLSARAEWQQVADVPIAAQRGTIYDRNLTPLAMTLPVASLAANPRRITDATAAAAQLAPILAVDRSQLARSLSSRHSFVWVARQMTSGETQAVASLHLAGLELGDASRRFYPKGDLASSVLGYVGVDGHGLGGIERAFDPSMHGREGSAQREVDAHRQSYGQISDAAQPGENLVLTLDQNIQYIAQQALDAQVAKVHALRGTVIVEDPRTGEILALANTPTFNPDDYRSTPAALLGDPAVSSPYEPGSVFKLVTVSAALQQNVITPDEIFDCQNGSIKVGGRVIHENRGEHFGLLSVTDILVHSSNVGAIKIGEKLGDSELYKYIRAYGFGSPTGMRLPGESRGIIRPPRQWTPMSIGAVSMGQEVAVTPVQVVAMVSSLANGGLYVPPRVVLDEFSGPAPLAPPAFVPEPARRIVSPLVANEVKQMMAQVVLTGTGRPAQLSGYTAAGKTGTAEKVDPGTHVYSKRDVMASFAGFAPINDPAVVILTVIDTPCCGLEGGEAAGPVFKAIAEKVLPYLGVPHDIPVVPVLAPPVRIAAQPPSKPLAPAPALAPVPMAATSNQIVLDYAGSQRVSVPDFSGDTVRSVSSVCQHLGLALSLQGSGIARTQSPAAGTRLEPGAHVLVRFSPQP